MTLQVQGKQKTVLSQSNQTESNYLNAESSQSETIFPDETEYNK